MAIPKPILPSAPNFRDLGDIATLGGTSLRQGRVFRSEILDRISDADQQTLAALKIAAVCDLRHGEERHKRQNRWPAEQPVQHVNRAPEEGLEAVQSNHIMQRIAAPDFKPEEAMAVLQRAYRRMPVTLAPSLAGVLQHLSRTDSPPLLIHCTSGKDRSGFICALLLAALDLPLDAIYADYMLSKRCYPLGNIRKTMEAAFPEPLPPGRMELLIDLATVHPSYLDASFGQIQEDYGGIKAYLRQVIGMTADQERALRKNLLEE